MTVDAFTEYEEKSLLTAARIKVFSSLLIIALSILLFEKLLSGENHSSQ